MHPRSTFTAELGSMTIHAHIEASDWDLDGTATAYQLHWNDRMCNEWTEDFPDLASALLRLALLAHGDSMSDGNFTFNNGSSQFPLSQPLS